MSAITIYITDVSCSSAPDVYLLCKPSNILSRMSGRGHSFLAMLIEMFCLPKDVVSHGAFNVVFRVARQFRKRLFVYHSLTSPSLGTARRVGFVKGMKRRIEDHVYKYLLTLLTIILRIASIECGHS